MIAAISIASYFLLRPNWVTFVSNADFQAVSQYQNVLDSMGIPHRTTNNATGLMIREQDADRARLAIATSDIPNIGIFTFQDALEESGIGRTDRVIQQNFQRALESDLAQSIRLIEGVDNAVVNLSLPRRSPIPLPNDERASAGVMLATSRPLDRHQAAAIARYLAMSVEGLDVERVTITDTVGNMLFYEGETTQGHFASGEFELERLRRAELETQIRFHLGMLFDEVRVLPNLVLSLDQVETHQTIFNLPGPLDEGDTGFRARMHLDRMQTENRSVQLEPGLAPNALQDHLMGAPTEGSASTRTEDVDFLYDSVVQFTRTPSGGVQLDQSSVAVLVFRHVNVYEQHLVNTGVINDEMTWEMYIQQTVPTPIEISDEIRNSIQTGTGLATVTVEGFEVPIFVPWVQPPGINIATMVALGILALLILLLALGILRKAQADEVTEIEPELSVEDLLVSTQLEEQREAEAESTLGSITVEDSELKKLLDKFVDDKPDAAAQLLRNWLSEDWR